MGDELGDLMHPRLWVRVDSIDLGLDFSMMLACNGSPEDRPSVLLTRLARAVQDSSALDLQQSSELQRLEKDMQRCFDARKDMHHFYRQLSQKHQQMSVKLHQMKIDYHREVDHLREMLRKRNEDPRFKPDDITFFDPAMYTVPSWQEIVRDLDRLRTDREMKAVRAAQNGGSERIKHVAVEMWCKTCKANLPSKDVEKEATCSDGSTQTDEIFQISRPVQTEFQAQPENQSVQTVHCTNAGNASLEVFTQVVEHDFYQYSGHDSIAPATVVAPACFDMAVQTDYPEPYGSNLVTSYESLEPGNVAIHVLDPLPYSRRELQQPQQQQRNKHDQAGRKRVAAAPHSSDDVIKISNLCVSLGGDDVAHANQLCTESNFRPEKNEFEDSFENSRQESGWTDSGKSVDQQRELAWRLLACRLINFQRHMLRHSMAKLHTHAVADSLVQWAGRRPKAPTVQLSQHVKPDCLPRPGRTNTSSLRARSDLVIASDSPKMSMRQGQSLSCREDVRSTSKDSHLSATLQPAEKAMQDSTPYNCRGNEQLLPAGDGSMRKRLLYPSLLGRPQAKQNRLPAIHA